MKILVSSFLLASVLAACGGGSDKLCDAICDYDLRCDPEATTCNRAECDGFAPRLRPQAEEAMTACFEDLACDASDDLCFDAGIEAVSERAIDDQFVTRCNAAVDTCAIEDDMCFAAILFEQVHVENALDCFDLPCGEIEACFEDVFGA